jgi:ankyrin repeat protein
LLENSADVNVNARADYGLSLWHLASGLYLVDLVEALIRHGADVEARDILTGLP